MNLIGLTGYDRCGKDTIAIEILKVLKARKFKSEIIRLADPLKDFTSLLLNIDKGILEKFKNDNIMLGFGTDLKTTRDIIISVATAFRKYYGEDFFINHLFNSLKEDVVYIIPDVRFKIEAEKIKQNNGILIRVNSDLYTCGKNGKRYEVDDIVPDFNINNKADEFDSLATEINNAVGFILNKFSLQ